MYPLNYPNKDNLIEINHNLIDLTHKSIKQSYVNKTSHQISPEIVDLIKQKKKIRRQIKSAKDDTFYRLRREINFLQIEIRRALKRSNEMQSRKLIEAAKQAGNKGLWKAIKTITSEHQYENEDLERHFLDTEQKTKLLLAADSNETTEEIFLSVEHFNKILKHTSKSYPGPDKISYQLLKALPNNIKAFICIIISCSINNSYVACLWKDSQVTMLPKPQKDRKKAENYRPISLTNCIAMVCEIVVKYIILDHCEANKVFGPQQSA